MSDSPVEKTPIIKLESLSVSLDKNLIIKDASFSIDHGDFIYIIGENGSGKTTLVRAILGLIPIKSGKITVCKKHALIGYLPQESNLDPNFPATVEEIVSTGNLGKMRLQPFYKSAEKSAAKNAMKLLRIDSLAKKKFVSLSGGQKQKTLLARALTSSPDILILDEPSNNLDAVSRKDIYRALETLSEQGQTILLITHDPERLNLKHSKTIEIKDKVTHVHA